MCSSSLPEAISRKPVNYKEVQILRMTLDELINAMEPQARKDKALISKCVDGLTEYAAELRQKAGDAGKEQISALRRLVDELAGYTDAETFLQCIRDELPNHPVTGFRYETLTDDPAIRKQVDDILYDLYGEENPRPLEDYENTPQEGMTMGGMT